MSRDEQNAGKSRLKIADCRMGAARERVGFTSAICNPNLQFQYAHQGGVGAPEGMVCPATAVNTLRP